MSKLIKPRYEYYKGTTEVIDNELDTFVEDVVLTLNVKDSNIKELVRIKNNQYEQISDLQHRLEVSERATELACKRLQDDYCINCDNQTNCSRVEMCEKALSVYLPSDFKEQAESELKGE